MNRVSRVLVFASAAAVSLALFGCTGDDGGGGDGSHSPHGSMDYGPETVTEYTWGGSDFVEDIRRTYSYDAGGKVDTILEEIWAGAAWQDSLLTTYTYNGDDTVNTVTADYWDGMSWTVNTVTTCSYAGGVMTSREEYDAFLGATERTTFTYGGGRVSREENQEWDGTAWTPLAALNFAYDGHGRVASGTMEGDLGGGLTEMGTMGWTYDAVGRLGTMTMVVDLFMMSVVMGPAVYGAEGSLQSMETNMTSFMGDEHTLIECSYGVDDRLQEVLQYDWDDGTSAWILAGKTTHTHTDAGSSFTFRHESASPAVMWPVELYGCGDVNPHLWP